MKVAKFGGTSLADAGQIRKICDIILADPDRKIVVVSAPGKRYKEDIKVTDLLIACANAFLSKGSADKEFQAIVDRYAEIQKELDLPESVVKEIAEDFKKRLATDTSHSEKFMDTMKAGGEDNAARLTAEALRKMGADAHYVNPKDAGLLLSDEFGNAQVLPESYANLKKALQSAPGITVFPGFFGYTRGGDVATFPRGGSDITGSILAAAVNADLYENFTDVDSVYAADPRIITNAQAISEMTYREMRELSYAGFGVFHDEAVLPAVRAGVPIAVKNTNCPSALGTYISRERNYKHGSAVGIAGNDGFCTIYLQKYLMNREIGFGQKLLRILQDEGISFEHVPSGIDIISVILRESYLTPEVEQRVLDRIRKELAPDDITVERGLALIMIVGEGMRFTRGMAARAARALADSDINIEMINQGSSEISMMFGIKAEDRAAAIKTLYQEFFENKA